MQAQKKLLLSRGPSSACNVSPLSLCSDLCIDATKRRSAGRPRTIRRHTSSRRVVTFTSGHSIPLVSSSKAQLSTSLFVAKVYLGRKLVSSWCRAISKDKTLSPSEKRKQTMPLHGECLCGNVQVTIKDEGLPLKPVVCRCT